MSAFDQRGQKVGKQTNIAGNQYIAGGDIHHVEGDVVHGDKIAGDKIAGDKVAGDKNVVVARRMEHRISGLVFGHAKAARTPANRGQVLGRKEVVVKVDDHGFDPCRVAGCLPQIQ